MYLLYLLLAWLCLRAFAVSTSMDGSRTVSVKHAREVMCWEFRTPKINSRSSLFVPFASITPTVSVPVGRLPTLFRRKPRMAFPVAATCLCVASRPYSERRDHFAVAIHYPPLRLTPFFFGL